MREVSYVLRFERQAKDAPAVAHGLGTVTTLGAGGEPVATAQLATGGSRHMRAGTRSTRTDPLH